MLAELAEDLLSVLRNI